MDAQTLDLGFILRKFPEFDFTMSEFDDRLRLQKFIYLMQSFDVYLGYDFSWYLRGPYCTRLTTCGFALDDGIYQHIPPDDGTSRFASETVQRRFNKFKEYIEGKETDATYLEIAASLHYLIKADGIDESDALDMVYRKVPDTTHERCENVLKEMKEMKLV